MAQATTNPLSAKEHIQALMKSNILNPDITLGELLKAASELPGIDESDGVIVYQEIVIVFAKK